MVGTHPGFLRGHTGCELGVPPRETGHPWKESQSPVSILPFAASSPPAGNPTSGLSTPVLAKKQGAARGGERGRQPLGSMLHGGKRHQQSGWQSLSEPRCWGHLGDRHLMPLPCSPTPFQADRPLHNQLCPALQSPRSFHRSRHSCPPRVAEPDPAPGMAPEEPGQGSGHGSSARGHVLPAQPWLGPAGSGAGRAWRKRSRTCCTRPGMLREPHTCLAQVFPAPLSRHRSPARLQLRPFSLGLQTARGGCAPTPGSIPQARGMGQSIQPFLGRVEIILTEPYPSSLGISRQVCDSPGHLGKAWVILQPQGSNRSLPLHPRRDFLGKLGWNFGGAGMLAAPPHPLAC